MTEKDWQQCTDVRAMLEFLRTSGKISNRKLRLFACACLRRDLRELGVRWAGLIETNERHADGLTHRYEFDAIAARSVLCSQMVDIHYAATYARFAQHVRARARATAGTPARHRAMESNEHVGPPRAERLGQLLTDESEAAAQACLARCIFTGQLRRPEVAPVWLTPISCRLARTIYRHRHLPTGTFDNTQLAILAAALEEAGCTDPAILGHLRSPSTHVRGCWVVDLCLGKR